MHTLLLATLGAALAATPSQDGNPFDPGGYGGLDDLGAPSAKGGDELVRVTLLADREVVRPGERFALGVRLAIEPGWHVYWLNPGDGGLPTRASVAAPDGVTLGPVRFPGPHAMTLPGDIVNYGYEEEVLLWLDAEASADLEPGARLRLTASCDWLVCEEICLPGAGTATLELEVGAHGAAERPANAELFAHWAARLPRPLAEREDARVAWSARGERPTLRVDVAGASELELFPLETPGLRVMDVRVADVRAEKHAVLVEYERHASEDATPPRAAGVLRVVDASRPPAERERFYRIDHALDEASGATKKRGDPR